MDDLMPHARSNRTHERLKRPILFAAVGTIGFIVDSATLLLCIGLTGLGPVSGRIVSFSVAMTTTWQLNRRFTYRSTASPWPEFAKFVATNSLGALVNIGVYTLTIKVLGDGGYLPIVGVAAGSLCGMVLNYICSTLLVFRSHL